MDLCQFQKWGSFFLPEMIVYASTRIPRQQGEGQNMGGVFPVHLAGSI